MSFLLALLYPIAIQFERETWPAWVQRLTGWFTFPMVLRAACGVVGIVALFVDVVANYTELALLTMDRPLRGELTFSTRCVRLQHCTGWKGFVGRITKAYTNFFDPQGNHIV